MQRISSFDFKPGRRVAGTYEIVSKIGTGWESEVYLVNEIQTGVELAAKFFFPHRNLKDKAAKAYSMKLHKLRDCPMVIKYHAQESIRVFGQDITFIVSEYVKGEILSELLKYQPGKRLNHFMAVHLLYALAVGIEAIHKNGEYHGDLHSDNIIVRSFGLHFDIKLLDFFYWNAPKKENIQDDIVAIIGIFHEAMGGARLYSKHPKEIKNICSGLKRSLILKKFRTAGLLKNHLELLKWVRE